MPVYRVIAGDEARQAEMYFDADDEGKVRELVAARGLVITQMQRVDALPDGASVQRISAPRPGLRERDPLLHRIRLMALGVVIGLAVCFGVVFVNRARQHLTRTDVYPTTQAGETAPPGASPTGMTPDQR